MFRRPDLLSAYEQLVGSAPASASDLRLDDEFLRRVHRRRAFAVHPDRAAVLGRSEAELEDELKAVNRAYETLRGAARRTPVPEPKPKPRARAENRQWRGRVPDRALPFGEFLYYTHRIGWTALVDAIAWQRRQRPMLGQIARETRLLDSFEVAHVVRGRERHERFGECAVRLGYLNHAGLSSLLARQSSQQNRIGQYFVEAGVLDREELDALAADQRSHNRQFAA
ncbi:MAG: J domain-containing protein [Myxococcota bacterium]